MIERKEYLEQMNAFREKQLIKVITGVRRCGKSTLLEMYRDKLLAEGVPASRIIFINFDDFDNRRLLDPAALHEEISSRINGGGTNFIFLDEIQKVKDFEAPLSSIYLNKNADIYVTGSNANMLSGELASALSGRYIQIKALPLSFKEFAGTLPQADRVVKAYKDYQITGSFPYALQLDGSADKARTYLESLYDTILLRDVAQRKELRDVALLDRLAKFMLTNTGNLTSIKKISDTLTSYGRKVSAPTIESYLSALADAFLLYRAKRYDIKGKQYLATNDKYYIVDIGLRNAVLGGTAFDTSHALENIVYLELLRRGYDVSVGKVGAHEVDFVAMKSGIPEYFQVSETARIPDVLERELRPLRAIADSNRKYLLTLDEDPEANIDGIVKRNVIDFLVE
jgi:predicted AAA+ superfamily ATPase